MAWQASETIYGQRSGEARFVLAVEIGTPSPYQNSRDEWICPAGLAGLREGSHEAHGGSALQALCLAVGLAYSELRAFQEDGGTLSCSDGTPFDLDATFGRSLIA